MDLRTSSAFSPRHLKAYDTRRIDGTDLRYDESDLDSQGKLSLMVATQSRKALAELRRELKVNGADVTGSLGLVGGLVANVPEQQAAKLIQNLPKGTRIFVDSTIHYADSPAADTLFTNEHTGRDPGSLSSSTDVPGPAPLPSGPIDVDRAVINMDKVWAAGYTGKGQTAAVIDSGVYMHPDLKHAVVAFKDIADDKPQAYDAYGHGTHVAGTIAGDGTQSHGQVKGTAPDAHIAAVRITTVSEAIQGLQWVIANKDKYGIGVINLSLGDTATDSWKNDLWCQACDKAIKAGLIVVVAAGNEGPDPGSVSTPGIDPNVITVGALDDQKTTDATKWQVGSFSSEGPTAPDKIDKPDVIAPGVRVWGPLSPNSKLDAPEIPHMGNDYEALTGSSQATPMVSGLILCLKQAYPGLTQEQAKDILEKTARPLPGASKEAQGAGVVDGWAALQAVLALKKEAEAKAAAGPQPVQAHINAPLAMV